MMTGLVARYARVLLVLHRCVCLRLPSCWVARPDRDVRMRRSFPHRRVSGARAKAALAAILAVLEGSALLHWMATWIYLIVLNQVRLFCPFSMDHVEAMGQSDSHSCPSPPPARGREPDGRCGVGAPEPVV